MNREGLGKVQCEGGAGVRCLLVLIYKVFFIEALSRYVAVGIIFKRKCFYLLSFPLVSEASWGVVASYPFS